MKTAAAAALPWLLGACVLVPLWAWSPYGASDSRLDGGLLTLLTLACALCAAATGRLRWIPGSLWLLAALAAGILAALLAGTPPILGGLADRAPLLAFPVLLCCAAAAGPSLRRAAPWILAGVALAGLYGIAQYFGWDPLHWRPEPQSPPVAPLPNTNAAAELFVLAIVAAAARLRPPWSPDRPVPRRTRTAYALVLVPLTAFVMQLGVTAAALALGAGLLWLGLRDRARRPGALLLLLVAGLAGALGPGLPSPPIAAAPPATPPHADTAGPVPASFQVRWLLYGAALRHALAQPQGIGLGRFELDYPAWRPAEELRLSSADFTDPAVPRPDTPHSEPLLILVECGWAGALLAAAGAVLLLRRPGRARWTGAALLALAVHALVRSPLSDNPPVLALAALLLGWERVADARRSAWPQRAGLVLVAAAAAVPALPQILGERALAQHFRGLEQAPPAAADGELARALRWRPWDTVAADLRAVQCAAGGDLAGTRAALDQALRYDPADLNAMTARLKLEMTASDGDEALALQMLARAEALYAAHPSVRDARTRWLELQAQRQKDLAMGLLGQDVPRAQLNALLRAHHLLAALADIRRGDAQACRGELEAAAVLSSTEELRLSRFARGPLSEAEVAAVVAELLPEYAGQLGLGPAPAAAIPAEPRPAPSQ